MPAATRSVVARLRRHKRVVLGVVATAGGALLLATCVAGAAAVHSPTRTSANASRSIDSGPPGGVGADQVRQVHDKATSTSSCPFLADAQLRPALNAAYPEARDLAAIRVQPDQQTATEVSVMCFWKVGVGPVGTNHLVVLRVELASAPGAWGTFRQVFVGGTSGPSFVDLGGDLFRADDPSAGAVHHVRRLGPDALVTLTWTYGVRANPSASFTAQALPADNGRLDDVARVVGTVVEQTLTQSTPPAAVGPAA